jgi:hypothetical protein
MTKPGGVRLGERGETLADGERLRVGSVSPAEGVGLALGLKTGGALSAGRGGKVPGGRYRDVGLVVGAEDDGSRPVSADHGWTVTTATVAVATAALVTAPMNWTRWAFAASRAAAPRVVRAATAPPR